MTKLGKIFKAIACITCLAMQMNNVHAQTWPPSGMLGAGTQNAPWEITTIGQLMDLANYVNAGNGSQTIGKYYKLMNNIAYISASGIAAGWDPIGNNIKPGAIFQGNFDGNGKVVSNIVINRSTKSYLGLFGYVSNATIYDLGVRLRSITGDQYVGVLIGRSDNSTIERCYAADNGVIGASIVGGLVGGSYNSLIHQCYATCNVSGNISLGGLIGANDGTIQSSYADGNVTANGNANTIGNQAGGFVGSNSGTIVACYATGDVTGIGYLGGFVGVNRAGNIIYCYATGNITGIRNFIGGLVGENRNGATLQNCVAANNTITGGVSSMNINRVAGANTAILTNHYAFDGMVITPAPNGGDAGTPETMATLMSFDFYNIGNYWVNNTWHIATPPDLTKKWIICDGQTLPILTWQWQTQGFVCNSDPCNGSLFQDGTVNNPYLICTVQDLVDLAIYVNGGNATNGRYWKMMNDLDLQGIIGFPIIGDVCNSFQGHFDGNYKVISNLTLNGITYYTGLFARISNAEIKNLGIEACQITGPEWVGALSGTVADISIIENCYATGSVTGTGDFVGGLIGSCNSSTITNSYAICNMSGISAVGGLVGTGAANCIIDKSHASGNVLSADGWTGGLVGVGTIISITDCYATGNITGEFTSSVGGLMGSASPNNNITCCYATGNITITGASVSHVGGLAGRCPSGNITNCYATGNITTVASATNVGGFVGGTSSGVDITGCYATGNIIGTGASNSNIGGLVGVLPSSITGCYAIGDITVMGTSNSSIGGLVGNKSSTYSATTNCYATGNIVAGGTSNSNVGGLVGTNSGPITYCYASGDITGTGGTSFGGLVGYSLGILRNCVAANAIVSGGTSNINSVAGTSYGTLSNNYAFDGMSITPNGGNAGISATMATLMSFGFYNTGNNWFNSIPWSIGIAPSPNTIWMINDGQTLPFLQPLDCGSRSLLHAGNQEEEYPTEHHTKSAFSIFPNPTSNAITISSERDFHTIEIVDLLGRAVHFQQSNGNTITLDVSGYSNGIYFVRMMTEDGTKVEKFVKQ